jgi:hypothetical protein
MPKACYRLTAYNNPKLQEEAKAAVRQMLHTSGQIQQEGAALLFFQTLKMIQESSIHGIDDDSS